MTIGKRELECFRLEMLLFYAQKHEKSGERLKKSYKLRYVAIKSIYISEKISKFALRTNKFLLIWKI